MKYSFSIAGAAFLALSLAATVYAAPPQPSQRTDDALEAVPVMGAPVEDIDVTSYEPDDSVEYELDDSIDEIASDEPRGIAHKSEVAKAVAELLDTADRDGKVGPQVRVLAEEQAEIHDDVADKMDMVSHRDPWTVFFIGSDYRTLGELRTALVASENGLDVLRMAREQVHPTLQDDLTSQITALEEENTKTRHFIEVEEGKFSLFGWLAKYF